MRAAGISTMRIGLWIGERGLHSDDHHRGLLGEVSAPPLEQYGRQMKTLRQVSRLQHGGQQERLGEGRQHDRSRSASRRRTIVTAASMCSSSMRSGGLRSVGRAEQREHRQATICGSFENYVESRIDDERVRRPARKPQTQLQTTLSPEFLGLAVLDADIAAGPRACTATSNI